MLFYNKSKILIILFIFKYEAITLFDEFLVLLGPIISRFFACSNEGKNKQKQQRVLALVLSLWFIPDEVLRLVLWFRGSLPKQSTTLLTNIKTTCVKPVRTKVLFYLAF